MSGGDGSAGDPGGRRAAPDSSPPSWPESPFWTFSTALYAAPGVEAACLDLQRRHGLDVNLVLLCLWLGSRNRALDASSAARLADAAAIWQAEVVRPLRAVRRRLKVALADPPRDGLVEAAHPLAAALRQRVMALEIDAERVEQIALEGHIRPLPAGEGTALDLAAANLARFWTFRPEDAEDLRALLAATCPAADPVSIARAVRDLTGG